MISSVRDIAQAVSSTSPWRNLHILVAAVGCSSRAKAVNISDVLKLFMETQQRQVERNNDGRRREDRSDGRKSGYGERRAVCNCAKQKGIINNSVCLKGCINHEVRIVMCLTIQVLTSSCFNVCRGSRGEGNNRCVRF